MRMQKAFLAPLLAGLVLLGAAGVAQGATSVSLSFFHSELSPHGRWVVAGSVGQVWVPSGVAAGWAPYTDGEWTLTDYGWTWVSYDPWATFPATTEPGRGSIRTGWVWAPESRLGAGMGDLGLHRRLHRVGAAAAFLRLLGDRLRRSPRRVRPNRDTASFPPGSS